MHEFLKSGDMHGNIVFNLHRDPISDLSAFALGYRRAGKTLANQIANAGGYPDYDGYPIFFVYRHALELYLKSLVYKGAKLLGLLSSKEIDTNRLFRTHRLPLLLPAVQAIFEDRKWAWELDVQGLRTFAEFQELINAIDDLDPESHTFRYPVGKEGKALMGHHVVLDVIQFARGMDALLELLDGALTQLECEWDAAAEVLYRLQQFLDELNNEAQTARHYCQ